jgi:hypothetical protein
VLSNAVEHHDRERPEVTVFATETDEYVEVRIADDGPGVPDDIEATVFRRDHRGPKAPRSTRVVVFFLDTAMHADGGPSPSRTGTRVVRCSSSGSSRRRDGCTVSEPRDLSGPGTFTKI